MRAVENIKKLEIFFIRNMRLFRPHPGYGGLSTGSDHSPLSGFWIPTVVSLYYYYYFHTFLEIDL